MSNPSFEPVFLNVKMVRLENVMKTGKDNSN